mgnify:CR=1 FL=1
MIEVYSWATPNGHKVHIMLEECALPYRVIPIDIGAGDQFKPEFLAISPNNKIPAIVDPEGPDGKPIALFESGAILLYLAAKTGRFLPADVRGQLPPVELVIRNDIPVGKGLGSSAAALTAGFNLDVPKKVIFKLRAFRNFDQRWFDNAYGCVLAMSLGYRIEHKTI